MSVNSVASSSAFNVDGVLSGLKTSDLINQLSIAEQQAIKNLQNQKTKITTRDKAYQDLNTKVVSFQSSLKMLLMSSTVNGRSALSSAPTIATASATADAANGVFTVNVLGQATTTSITSGAAVGQPAAADMSGNVDPSVLLKNAGLTTPVTAGTFTINGHQITVDPNTQTWADVNTAIQAATGGSVSLSFGANQVSLVSSGSPMQIGTATDTSNFLSATHLADAAQVDQGGGNYKVTSNQLLGGAVTTVALSSAHLATAINDNGATGAFTVNGVTINWTAGDSLNTVLGRINSSSANVRAAYDPTTDKINLTNVATGAQDVALSDTSGNFLAAAGLTAGSVKTVGVPATYTITQNGVTSATQYSNSNVVSNALPGITLTLSALGSTTVTVSQDTASAQKSLQNFVDQFNGLVDLIDKDTAYDTSTKTGAVLSGDANVRMLGSQLRSMITSAAITPSGAAYKTMGDIGISTGAFGAQVGTTKHLALDSAKLTAALQSNPNAVFDVLSGLAGTTTKGASDPANPWLASVAGTPYAQVNSGTYRITHDGAGNLSSVFTPTSGVAQAAVLGTITAGGTNSTLINGLTLTATGALPAAAGTDNVTFTVTSRGVLQNVSDYLNGVLGSNGMFAAETSSAASDQRRLDTQINDATDRLQQKQLDLQRKFTAMEQALATLQQQSTSIMNSLPKNSNS